MRNPLKVDIMRDRGALAREVGPGLIENVYRVQLMNTDEHARQVTISGDWPARTFSVSGVAQPITLEASVDTSRSAESAGARRLHVAGGVASQPGTHKVEFIIQAVDDEKVVRHEQSSFIIPR